MFKKFTILLVCFLLAGCAKGEDCNSTVPVFERAPNNLAGDVNVEISKQNHDKGELHIFVLLDGKKQGEFFLYTEKQGDSKIEGAAMIRTQFFSNGPHTVTLVSKDFNLAIVCQTHTKVVFNNELSSVCMDKGYWFDEDFNFSALSLSKSANYVVEVSNFSADNIVYSQNFTGDINAVIPPKVFDIENSQTYVLKVKDSFGNVKFENWVCMDADKELEYLEKGKK